MLPAVLMSFFRTSVPVTEQSDTVAAEAGLAQSAGVIVGIKVLCVLLPAIFIIGSWAAFRYVWNVTDEIRAEIAAKKAAKAQVNTEA